MNFSGAGSSVGCSFSSDLGVLLLWRLIFSHEEVDLFADRNKSSTAATLDCKA